MNLSRRGLVVFLSLNFLSCASPMMSETQTSSAATAATDSKNELPASELQAIEKSLEQIRSNPDFVDLTGSPGLKLDIRYATANNFVGRNLYGPYKMCFLHRIAAEKLARATKILETKKPGYSLLIFDCLRPRSVQKILWAVVENTPQEAYVSSPGRGSIHNYGFAVDLSIADENGVELDMGTPYDHFSDLSEPKHEERYIKAGKLSATQIANRRLLRAVMTASGFAQLPNEWWHYDALPAAQVRSNHTIVE